MDKPRIEYDKRIGLDFDPSKELSFDGYEPHPYQEEFLKNLKNDPDKTVYIGYDAGSPDGDHTAISVMQGGKAEVIFMDEVSEWPLHKYKWYRNPIKWWQWRRIEKLLKKSVNRHD